MRQLLKRIANILGGLFAVAALLILYNIWFWLINGDPTVPRLEGRWWAGYYQTSSVGTRWCLARFYKDKPGQLKIGLLFQTGDAEILDVYVDSSDQSFVRLKLVADDRGSLSHAGVKIEAKQLYEGARYPIGRLLAGRFSDFWEENHNLRITGFVGPASGNNEFVIEPIDDTKLTALWRNFVHPGQPTSSPLDTLRAVGGHL